MSIRAIYVLSFSPCFFPLLFPLCLFSSVFLSRERHNQQRMMGYEALKQLKHSKHLPTTHTHTHTVHLLPHSSAHSCRGSPESPMCLFCICQQKQVCRCPLFRSRRTCSAFKYLTQGPRMLYTLDANERITVTGWDCVGLATLCLTLW